MGVAVKLPENPHRASTMNTFLQDTRFGLRMLAKNPGFTAIAVLTLALGIGVNTAVFTAYNAVALRPLQAKDPGQMVNVYRSTTQDRASHTLTTLITRSTTLSFPD